MGIFPFLFNFTHLSGKKITIDRIRHEAIYDYYDKQLPLIRDKDKIFNQEGLEKTAKFGCCTERNVRALIRSLNQNNNPLLKSQVQKEIIPAKSLPESIESKFPSEQPTEPKSPPELIESKKILQKGDPYLDILKNVG